MLNALIPSHKPYTLIVKHVFTFFQTRVVIVHEWPSRIYPWPSPVHLYAPYKFFKAVSFLDRPYLFGLKALSHTETRLRRRA